MTQAPPAPEATPPPPPPPSAMDTAAGVGSSLLRSLVMPALALVVALVIGAIIIAFSDVNNVPLLFEDPGAALSAMAREVVAAYKALFVGAVGSVYAISETLFAATPLILASLGVALGFRAGLFNIGAQGQMLIGAMSAVWVGIYVDLPTPLHVLLAILAGLIGGMVWGGIAGLLKARTGAHEVITTIMFNFIALYLVQWLLSIPLFQEAGRNNPVSTAIRPTAQLSPIFGGSYRVTLGFAIALVAVFFVYWLLYRSSWGFEFRAIGLNPQAGAYAGMGVATAVTLAMAIAGGLAGVAGANQVMGLAPYKATTALAGSVGFDAITVALLGRSHPIGVLWAALLFGALKAGGRQMQGAAQIPLDLVVVLQALIVIFVAAPALVRAIFRMKGVAEKPAQMTKGWGA
ncbi:MAG TPA: ABC transporter permease [Acidimicrobiia bacterium]|nr:ABC transporter permease [Acidimicrobiia bacterium]